MTGLTIFVASFLRTGLVVFPLPLLGDLAEALDDERHLLIVELGGIDGDPTRCRVFSLNATGCASGTEEEAPCSMIFL